MGGYALNSITLLPGLFSATGADNGYIFVPDGSGALINFNNDCSAAYNGAVYGDDVSFDINMKRSYGKEINMPVFGMVSNNVGMMAIIDSCESIAQITAASKNLSNNYNYVYTTAVIKKSYAKSMFSGNDRTKSSARKRLMQISNDENFTVRYYLLGNNADYVTMANKYREYLKSEKGLTKNVSQPVLNVELIGAIDVKANFLGFSYFDIKALTTYKDAKEIISELKEAGVDNLALKYSGWSKSGLTNNKVLKNLKLEKELGNKKAFNELNSFADENSVKIDYDVEMLKFYKGGSKYKVSSPFNETISFSRYLRSVYAKDITKRSWFLLAPEYIEKNFNSVIKSAEKLDIESLSLTTLTNSLYSNSSVKSTLTRTEMISNIINSLDKAEVKFSGESANAYAIPYLSKIYATPTYSSGYRAFDEEIPFYQIVLHGYVDMTNEYQFTSNNRNVNYLRAVESGIQLLYRGIAEKTTEIVDTDYDYLYGTNFDTWKADAVKKYQEYQPLLNKIYDQEIVSHKKLQADVFETTYGNGVSVTVNYNSQPVTVNGAEISGYGFTAKGA